MTAGRSLWRLAAPASLALSGVILSAVALPPAAMAAPLKSPDDVKTALRLMMMVTNDFQRQLDRKTFNRLPHENQEFHEASGALTSAIAAEPAPFKARVGHLLSTAVAQAQAISDESGKAGEPRLRADHAKMVHDVKAVFMLFPADLRPDPNVQPGH